MILTAARCVPLSHYAQNSFIHDTTRWYYTHVSPTLHLPPPSAYGPAARAFLSHPAYVLGHQRALRNTQLPVVEMPCFFRHVPADLSSEDQLSPVSDSLANSERLNAVLQLKGKGINNLRMNTIGRKSLSGHDCMHEGHGLRCEAPVLTQSLIIPPACSRMAEIASKGHPLLCWFGTRPSTTAHDAVSRGVRL